MKNIGYIRANCWGNQIRKFNKIVADIPGQCEMKNIRYFGNQALPGGSKGGEMGPKC